MRRELSDFSKLVYEQFEFFETPKRSFWQQILHLLGLRF